MKKQGQKTEYPGVMKVGQKVFRVRQRFVDERTGKMKEVDKIVKVSTARQAAGKLAELVAEARERDAARKRISDFAQSWLESKSATVSTGPAMRYADGFNRR